MRILFFSHYFLPEGNAPASRVYALAKRWVNAGHEVQVITCAPNVPNGVIYDGYSNKLKQTEIMDGIYVTRVWTYIAPNKGTLRRILNYISYMISAVLVGIFQEKPDVVIATSPQFFCGWAGVILSKMWRLPFVLEIRDIWPESIVAVGAMSNKRFVRFLKLLELRMYRAADHIVTVGEGYKDRLLEKDVPEEKISVVMNGVDTDQFSPREPDQVLKKDLNLNGKFICSYIGTVGMACGLDVVLRAAQFLKKKQRHNIMFLFVGDGAVKDELQQKARDQDLKNILFVGKQDKKLIPDFLSITDACLVHLKKTELFRYVLPSKIFDAAAMAKPIILGVEGYAADFVKRAGAGICIEPENATQLVQAIETLADNRELCTTLGQDGYDHAVKYFNRNHLANTYLSILEKVSVPTSTLNRKTRSLP